MKMYSILIFIFLLVLSISAQDDVYSNKFAPSDYDANLKKGDKAIGVVHSSLEAFTVVSKSG